MENIIDRAEYIDAHTHLDLYSGDNIPRVLSEINNYKIFSLANSMDHNSFINTLNLAQNTDFIIPCFGLHPWKVTNNTIDWDMIESCISESIMVGEIGVDFLWVEDKSTFPIQIEVFTRFIELACKYKKPVNIHTKDAEYEILNILKKATPPKTIIHWYSGPMELVQEFVDLGCMFTFSVDILENEYSQKLCAMLPTNIILPETDNPGGYSWLYDRDGFPKDIIKVYEKISHIKGIPICELKQIFRDNIKSIFITNDNI